MTLRLRRILYTTFIILFFLAAPPLVLYTAGYRYDFRYGRVVETGSLVIRSRPEKADIYLDEKLYRQATPTIINNLLPGKLNLRVSKEGYHDWIQQLEISPRLTGFEENIKLYPKKNPQSLLPDKAQNYWWNKKADKLVYTNAQNQLKLFNLLNKADDLILDLDKSALQDLDWSPHNDKFFLTTLAAGRLNNLVIEPLSGNAANLNQLLGLRFNKLQWDPNSPDTLYGLSQDSLYRLSLPLKTARIVNKSPVTQFLAAKDRILLLEPGGRPGVNYVSWRGLAENSAARRILTRRGEDKSQFLTTNSNLIAVYDESAGKLDLIDPEDKNLLLAEPMRTLENVTNIIFSAPGDKMVYSDGFGIYQENIGPIEETSRDLIIRYSDPVTSLGWADDEFHIFYLTAGSLRLAELKSSTEPRVLKLAEGLPESKKINFITPLGGLTYIDEEENLQYLSLDWQNGRAALFGN